MNNTDLAMLVLRISVGVVIAMHGFMKLGWVGKGGSPAGVAGWFENSLGFKPGIFWAWVSISAEALGASSSRSASSVRSPRRRWPPIWRS